MTKKDAIFLVEEFEKNALGLILKGKVLNTYYEAERILRGWDKPKPRGCSCELKGMATQVRSLFDQYRQDIYRLYEEESLDGQSTPS